MSTSICCIFLIAFETAGNYQVILHFLKQFYKAFSYLDYVEYHLLARTISVLTNTAIFLEMAC